MNVAPFSIGEYFFDKSTNRYYKRKRHSAVQSTQALEINVQRCSQRLYGRCMVRPIGYLLLQRRCFGSRYFSSPKLFNRSEILSASTRRTMPLSQALLARHKSFRWVLPGNLSDVQTCAMLPFDVAMLSCVDNNEFQPFKVGSDPHLVAVGSSNGACRVFLHDNGPGEGCRTKCPDQPGDGIIWRPSAQVAGGIVYGRRRRQRLISLWQLGGTSRVAALRWCLGQGHRRLLAVGFLGGRNSRPTLSIFKHRRVIPPLEGGLGLGHAQIRRREFHNGTLLDVAWDAVDCKVAVGLDLPCHMDVFDVGVDSIVTSRILKSAALSVMSLSQPRLWLSGLRNGSVVLSDERDARDVLCWNMGGTSVVRLDRLKQDFAIIAGSLRALQCWDLRFPSSCFRSFGHSKMRNDADTDGVCYRNNHRGFKFCLDRDRASVTHAGDGTSAVCTWSINTGRLIGLHPFQSSKQEPTQVHHQIGQVLGNTNSRILLGQSLCRSHNGSLLCTSDSGLLCSEM